MSQAVNHILRLIQDDSGATAIEYVVIASAIAIPLIPVLTSTTNGVASLFSRVLSDANFLNGT